MFPAHAGMNRTACWTTLCVTVQTPLIFFTQQEAEEAHPAPGAEP